MLAQTGFAVRFGSAGVDTRPEYAQKRKPGSIFSCYLGISNRSRGNERQLSKEIVNADQFAVVSASCQRENRNRKAEVSNDLKNAAPLLANRGEIELATGTDHCKLIGTDNFFRRFLICYVDHVTFACF